MDAAEAYTVNHRSQTTIYTTICILHVFSIKLMFQNQNFSFRKINKLINFTESKVFLKLILLCRNTAEDKVTLQCDIVEALVEAL